MAVMPERWNDGKMDGLAARVNTLGEQRRDAQEEMRELRQEIAKLRRDTKEGFERLYLGAIYGVLATGGFLAAFGCLITLIVDLR
jgi:hypothetical protein